MTNEQNATLERFLQSQIVLARLKLRSCVHPAEGAGMGATTAMADAVVTVAECEQELPSEIRDAYARLDMTKSEWNIVWLLAAEALDLETQRLFAALENRGSGISLRTLKRVVFNSMVSLDGNAALGGSGTLRRLGVIERDDGGPPDLHEGQQSWKLSTRFLNFLVGDQSHDETLRHVLRCERSTLSHELALTEGVLDEVRRLMQVTGEVVVVASGAPGTGRRSLFLKVAHEVGRNVIQVDASRLSVETPRLRRELRCLALELRLRDASPLLLNIDALRDERAASLDIVGAELAPLVRGLILATCGVHRPAMKWDRPVIAIELGAPTSAQRATLWHAALGQGTEADAELLATQYPLAPALIHHAAEAAKARAAGQPLQPEDIYAGIRAVLDDRLGSFARRVTVTQTWDDIVLPADQLDAVVELMARIRQRRTVYEQWGFAAKVGKGLGVSALFSGPPGTGKTMIAGLIAQDLGLELYQVDLSKIVSKWIGETEKHLAALFDAAEAGHAILLFDEADSLFGKRTDVKSSNDRNANLETNYLLQRLESFTGICLLTTNHESHIDEAFQRRLSLHLRFALPDVDERAQLWRAMLPQAAPVAANVDFGALARRFVMSGGYIRNAALRAAFLAADEGAAITAAHLERAARVEYEGLGKLAA